jgi:riboflavin kinase
MTLKKLTEIIHLPDLHFNQFCVRQFGINRGVLNTIDEWFFENGIQNILERRKRIYHFLTCCYQIGLADNGKMKFGHGNLSKELTEYLKRNYSYGYPISKQKMTEKIPI